MPGLFPRTMDLEMGWGDVDSCAGFKGNDVIQALADQPLLDLTGRGGGSSPQFASITSGIYQWATGTGIGPCNLVKTIVTGVVGGLETVIGAALNPFSDFGGSRSPAATPPRPGRSV
jgi:hypothetical protein